MCRACRQHGAAGVAGHGDQVVAAQAAHARRLQVAVVRLQQKSSHVISPHSDLPEALDP